MKGKLIGFAVALLAVATIGVVQLNSQALDNGRDKNKYAVVYNGTHTEQEARNAYNKGDNAAIFRHFGISKNEINGMKQGVVYRDGTVKVGGRVVARNAQTAIRHYSGGNIPGSSTAKRVSVSRMADDQTALVKFDQNGKFMFAIMKPCGNPVTGTPTPPPAKPSAACKNLTVTKLERTERAEFRLDATATVKHGAKVRGYIFQVLKDGKVIDTKRIDSAKLKESYTYSQQEAGTYQAKVTIRTSEGKQSGGNCIKSFTVEKKETPPPKTPGIKITKLVEGATYTRVNVGVEYTYQIAVTNTGNIDLKSAAITDTPEQGVTLISADHGTVSNNTWTYTIPALKQGETLNFNLKAKVPEYQAGRITNTVCVDTPDIPGSPDDCDKADVEVPKPEKVTVCNPDTGETITVNKEDEDQYAPVGSSECEKKETPVTPTTPKTPAPKELPKTGPGEAAMQLIGLISLVGASAYYLTSGGRQ